MKATSALAELGAFEAVEAEENIVFGLFKRNGRVYTEVVPDCSKATLQGIIRGRVELESIIHSDAGAATMVW